MCFVLNFNSINTNNAEEKQKIKTDEMSKKSSIKKIQS